MTAITINEEGRDPEDPGDIMVMWFRRLNMTDAQLDAILLMAQAAYGDELVVEGDADGGQTFYIPASRGLPEAPAEPAPAGAMPV